MGARCLLLGFVARLEGDPPVSGFVYIVCDGCGDLTKRMGGWPMGADWSCAHCESGAAWEFTDEDSARTHAARIRLFEPGFDPARSSYDRSAEAS